MKTYTKEQKQDYFKGLRERWQANKLQAENDNDTRLQYEAIAKESPNFRISYYGFYFTFQAMKAQNLDGLPYVDAKTFEGWRDAGFMVKKGQHSTIDGITWIESKKKKEGEEEDESFLYPKIYKLFHRSQVEPIK